MLNNIECQIKDIDCSPTKKYTKWLIKQYKISEFDINYLKSYIEEYSVLSLRGLIKTDIYSFHSVDELIKEIDTVNETKSASRKEDESDFDIILDNDDIVLMRPNSHAASRKLGLTVFKYRHNEQTGQQDSAWCTTYATDTHWNSYYLEKKYTFYYGKIKNIELLKNLGFGNQLQIFACAVNQNGSITIYDGNDNSIITPINYTPANSCDLEDKVLSFLNKLNIFNLIVPDNLIKRYDNQRKKLIKLLNQEIIDGDLEISSDVLINSNIQVKCKKINGTLLITGAFQELPKFLRNIEINGNFICDNIGLLTLTNCPRVIQKNIRCSDNKLVNLKGLPKKIYGHLDCSHNNINTLEYAPYYIGGSFNCCYNRLSNLFNFPKVNNAINVSRNILTSVKGLPKYINGGLDCSSNQLIKFDANVKKINGHLYLQYNNLITLKGTPKYIVGNFYCYKNNLKNLFGISKHIKGRIDCSYNKLSNLIGIPKYIEGLNCSGNELENLNGSPKFISGEFDVSFNNLTNLKNSPLITTYYKCSFNKLESLIGAPKKIKGDFYCDNNVLISLCHAPLIVGGSFNCCSNKIKNFKYAPLKANYFKSDNNELESYELYNSNFNTWSFE